MKIISFIYERTVIKKILFHLCQYSEPKQQRVPPAPEPQISIREYVSYDDGWPAYEEPSVDVNSL
jgi:hypothetical protein